MDVVVEAQLNHVVEVLATLVLVDIPAPDMSLTRKEYLAVNGDFFTVIVLFTSDDPVKAVSPTFLSLLGHEELSDFDVQWLLFPFAGQVVPFLFHMTVFIDFTLTGCNNRIALRKLFTECMIINVFDGYLTYAPV